MILPIKAKKIPNKAGKAWLKLKTPFCAEFMIRQLTTDRRTTTATPIFTNAPAEFWAFLFGSIAGKKRSRKKTKRLVPAQKEIIDQRLDLLLIASGLPSRPKCVGTDCGKML